MDMVIGIFVKLIRLALLPIRMIVIPPIVILSIITCLLSSLFLIGYLGTTESTLFKIYLILGNATALESKAEDLVLCKIKEETQINQSQILEIKDAISINNLNTTKLEKLNISYLNTASIGNLNTFYRKSKFKDLDDFSDKDEFSKIYKTEKVSGYGFRNKTYIHNYEVKKILVGVGMAIGFFPGLYIWPEEMSLSELNSKLLKYLIFSLIPLAIFFIILDVLYLDLTSGLKWIGLSVLISGCLVFVIGHYGPKFFEKYGFGSVKEKCPEGCRKGKDFSVCLTEGMKDYFGSKVKEFTNVALGNIKLAGIIEIIAGLVLIAIPMLKG